MIKLADLINLKPLHEAEEDGYTHVGYGRYKEKGKEDDDNAPTFEKDGDRFIPISAHASAAKEKDAKKVNIFNKDKKDKEEPKSDSSSEPDYDKYDNYAVASTAFYKGDLSPADLKKVSDKKFKGHMPSEEQLDNYMNDDFVLSVMAKSSGSDVDSIKSKMKELKDFLYADDNTASSNSNNDLEYLDASELEDKLDSLNLSDDVRLEVDKQIAYLKQQEYELENAEEDGDDDTAEEIQNNIDATRDEIGKMLKSSNESVTESAGCGCGCGCGGSKKNESINEAATKKIVIKVSELGKYDSYRDLFNRAWREFVIRYTKQNNIKYNNQTEAEYLVKKALKIPSPDNKHDEDAARYLVDKGILVLKESVNEGQYKTIMSNGGRNLFFAVVDDKTDKVDTIDLKKWLKTSLKDKASDVSKDRVIKAILKGQKQFNKAVEYNMWAKKGKPSFEDKINYFIKNGFINNITSKGIKVYESNESTKLTDVINEDVINEGTRSQVGIIKNGKIVSAYVHFDGYPSNMKPGLKAHMKDEKDVLTLIKKGGARGIFDDKPIEYYKQGTPLKGDVKNIEDYLKDAGNEAWADYVYLYNTQDKKWYYADVYSDKKLKKLY